MTIFNRVRISAEHKVFNVQKFFLMCFNAVRVVRRLFEVSKNDPKIKTHVPEVSVIIRTKKLFETEKNLYIELLK